MYVRGSQVALDLNKTEEEIRGLWENPISDPLRLAYRKYITASLYVDQVSLVRMPIEHKCKFWRSDEWYPLYAQVKEMVGQRYRYKRFPWSWKQRPAKLFPMRTFLRCVGR